MTDTKEVPPVDPTKNVLDLVEAAVVRINDVHVCELVRLRELREADSKLAKVLAEQQTRYMDAETRHTKEMSDLRALHARDMRTNEQDTVKLQADRNLKAIEILVTEVKGLSLMQSRGGGKEYGVDKSWGILLSVVAALLAIGAFVLNFINWRAV